MMSAVFITFQPCWNYKFYSKEFNINKKILEMILVYSALPMSFIERILQKLFILVFQHPLKECLKICILPWLTFYGSKLGGNGLLLYANARIIFLDKPLLIEYFKR